MNEQQQQEGWLVKAIKQEMDRAVEELTEEVLQEAKKELERKLRARTAQIASIVLGRMELGRMGSQLTISVNMNDLDLTRRGP